jgi:hypothetical protein
MNRKLPLPCSCWTIFQMSLDHIQGASGVAVGAERYSMHSSRVDGRTCFGGGRGNELSHKKIFVEKKRVTLLFVDIGELMGGRVIADKLWCNGMQTDRADNNLVVQINDISVAHEVIIGEDIGMGEVVRWESWQWCTRWRYVILRMQWLRQVQVHGCIS